MKLTAEQTKAVKAWIKKYGKGYISGKYDVDQMGDDCAYDLDLTDPKESRQVWALCDQYINETE